MDQMIKQKEPTVVKECRFAVYIEPPEHGMPDLHLVKEQVTYPDGSTKPQVQLIKDFQRPFWVSKKGHRNYEQKKEWEDKDKLIEGNCTQTNLVRAAAKALGTPWFSGDLRKLSSSPYLYGCDILSTASIKQKYMDMWPGVRSKYTVAVMDTETDVVSGSEEITICSLTFKNTVFTAVVFDFVKDISNVASRVEEATLKYLGEYIEKRKISSELVIVDSPIAAVKACLDKAHELKPDFLAFWNIDFDITKIIEACEKADVNPADLFSDPCVPKHYRFFRYKRGPKQKVTASGLVTPIKPAAQWHTVYCPSSFYLIDAMCVYKHTRIGKAEEQSYALDYILNLELGIRKLKFKEAEEYTGLRWHQFMQTYYKIEYIVYNRFDCISIEELDEKTNDMSVALPLFSGCSDFENFKSQPRRTVDALHFYCLKKHNKVIGTTGSSMSSDLDKKTLGLENWIEIVYS